MNKDNIIPYPKKLEDWLTSNKARFIREAYLPNGDNLTWHTINGKLVLIQQYAKDNGWDVYINPAWDTDEVDITFDRLNNFLKS